MRSSKSNWTTGCGKNLQIIGSWLYGQHKKGNDTEIIQSLVQNYQKLGYRMPLKIPFFHSHLSFFPKNTDAVSVE